MVDGINIILLCFLIKEFSGSYGIRLHIGPHYLRSSITTHECINGFYKFLDQYLELIINHVFSYYGPGYTDVDG